MNGLIRYGLPVLGIAAVAEIGISVYFYRRTMMRSKAKVERTMKMAGTDWSQYMPLMEKRKEYQLAQPHREIWTKTFDGLRLHATYFPRENEKKVVICFHGYTSEGMSDYIGLSDYYLKRGYSMLLVDERAHGKSEGTYIGFGCLDRKDALTWIRWVIGQCGEDVQILPARNVYGRSHRFDGERSEAAGTGQGNHLRLRIYLAKRGLYARTPLDVSHAGVSDYSDCRLDQPENGRIRYGRVQRREGSEKGRSSDSADPWGCRHVCSRTPCARRFTKTARRRRIS